MPRAKVMPRADRKLAIGYVGPNERRMSEQSQRQAIDEGARLLGITVVATFSDIAAAPLPARDGFIDALAAVEDKAAGFLMTAHVSVLASNAAEQALATRAINRAGARWRIDDPTGKWPESAVNEVLAVLRLHESLIYRPKTRLGLQRRGQGKGSGPAPWGYTRDEAGLIVPDEREQAAVAEVLRMRAAGQSTREIALFLESLALPRRPARVYDVTVKGIFRQADKKAATP